MNLLRFDSEAAWTRAVCSLGRDRLRLQRDMKICLRRHSNCSLFIDAAAASMLEA